MTLQGRAKGLFEQFFGNRVWLEPASDLASVSALIQMLRPVAVEHPLIRVGGGDDGGYLLPDDFQGITAAVSPGISTEISFDLDMASRGIPVYMADASVAGPPVDHPKFHFQKKFLDVFEDDTNFRLDTLCSQISPADNGDRILQMDIEGAEYRVLLDASDEVLKGFRIMLIEFHHLDRMLAEFPFHIIQATFKKLLRHHHVVHIHPNNIAKPRVRGDIAIPPVMEFTFYRRDRSSVVADAELSFPHPLDRDNVPHLSSVNLPECWK